MTLPSGTEQSGTVVRAEPNDMFRVRLAGGDELLCHIPASLRMKVSRILPGDHVLVSRSPLDGTRGRIVERAS